MIYGRKADSRQKFEHCTKALPIIGHLARLNGWRKTFRKYSTKQHLLLLFWVWLAKSMQQRQERMRLDVFFGKNQQNCRTWLKNQKSFFRWPSVQAFHLHRLNFYPIWIFVVELPAIPQKNFRHSWSSEFKARFRKCFWKYFDFFSVLRHYTAHLTKEANFWGNPSLYLC